MGRRATPDAFSAQVSPRKRLPRRRRPPDAPRFPRVVVAAEGCESGEGDDENPAARPPASRRRISRASSVPAEREGNAGHHAPRRATKMRTPRGPDTTLSSDGADRGAAQRARSAVARGAGPADLRLQVDGAGACPRDGERRHGGGASAIPAETAVCARPPAPAARAAARDVSTTERESGVELTRGASFERLRPKPPTMREAGDRIDRRRYFKRPRRSRPCLFMS